VAVKHSRRIAFVAFGAASRPSTRHMIVKFIVKGYGEISNLQWLLSSRGGGGYLLSVN
jgi:hypothetical protein